MTYAEIIEQTKKFQAEALGITEAVGREHDIQLVRRAGGLSTRLGEFAQSLDHCRLAAMP